MGDETLVPTTAKKPRSLAKFVLTNGPITITVNSIRDTSDVPGSIEDLFTVLGHTVSGEFYAGEGEVPTGVARPIPGEVWEFADDGDLDDTFPKGTKIS